MLKLVKLLLLLTIMPMAFAVDIKGVWQQGAVLRGQVSPGSQLVFQEKKVQVNVHGEFVLGLGRDAENTAKLVVTSPSGESLIHTYTVTPREYVIQRVNGVPAKTVNPSAAQRARTKKEGQIVWAARQKIFNTPHFMQNFVWPLVGPITGVYGSQRVYNGEPRRPHYGVDIAAPTGTPMVAPAAGIVTLAEPDLFYSGGTLILDHGHELSSTFLHLSRLHVKVGDKIKQGQLLAEVGATGRATGPHLDWRMNWMGERVDPVTLVGDMPKPASIEQ